ncbi:hypothetical protein K491DRAFT_688815 [Lophiostoma macrostomum CBS 122681]|uniref:HORMA domain-containing protein n=1 Tax=Lophiostoma macrostomum CBS 122681 TaxID=1314788 RepID=A0A6A6TM16_9PLEO|nr:hypothetical protein K491DRAFT_688815 [Lophiostoma macrostomum CBS 122681]
MARQRQKTRPVAAPKQRNAEQTTTEQTVTTTTSQVTTVQQSTELMQTLVHGTLSAFAFSRQLFGDHCFDQQYYNTSDRHWSYADYAAGNSEPSQDDENRRGRTLMQVLRRGRSTRVDALLDWLELGAFDALQKGFLRSIQVSLFENPDEQYNIVELYTFTFHYSDTNSGTPTVTAITSSTGGKITSDKITVKKARWMMQLFLRDVVTASRTLGAMPEEFHVRMHLTYTEECPETYEPPGFQASTDDTVFYPDNGYVKTTSTIPGIDAGHHTLSFKVSQLDSAHPGEHADEDHEELTLLPNGLSYGDRSSRLEDIDLVGIVKPRQYQQVQADGVHDMSRAEQPQMRPFPRSNGTQSNISAPSEKSSTTSLATVIQRAIDGYSDDSKQQETSAIRRVVPEVGDPITPGFSRQIREEKEAASTVTPSTGSEDMRVRDKLQNMLPLRTAVNNTQDTQQLSQSVHDSIAHSDTALPKLALQLSQTTIQQLDLRRSVLLPPRDRTPDMGRKPDKVECDCGWNEQDPEDDDMLFCGFCNTWQHCCCYGYRGADDSRLPPTHSCYTCLLQGKENQTLDNLRGLALYRRGIHLMERRGIANKKELSSQLRESLLRPRSRLTNRSDCDLQMASKVVDVLENQGFLAQPGQKKTKIKHLLMDKSKDVYRSMLEKYFDPVSMVAHHFETRPIVDGPFSQTTLSIRGLQEPRHQANAESTLENAQKQRYQLRGRGAITQADGDLDVATPVATPAPTRKRRGSTELASFANPLKKIRSSSSFNILPAGDFTPPPKH